MSLFGAKKQTPPLKELLGRAKENFERRMTERAVTISSDESSHIGGVLDKITGSASVEESVTPYEAARKHDSMRKD